MVAVLAAVATPACASGRPAARVLHVVPNGSDASRCTSSAPCASFERAYRVARPGDAVEVGGGSYGPQRLVFDGTKRSSSHVVFRPSSGASVRVEQLDFGQAQLGVRAAQHVTVSDMGIDSLRAWDGASDLLWQNDRGRVFNVLSGDNPDLPPASNIRIAGGSYGPCQAPRQEGCTSTLIGSNLVVDGAKIYGVTSTDLAGFHVDGLFIRGCRSCTVRNSKFYGNMITNIRIQNCCGLPDNREVTLANNWFAPSLDADGISQRGDAIDIDNPVTGLTIWNNSFAQNAGLSFAEGSYEGTRVVGNLMANLYQGCRPGVVYSNNLYIPIDNASGTPCGPTDRRVRTFGYVDPAALNYHIKAASPARQVVPAKLCPRMDIDRHLRPDAKRCDAGADQLQVRTHSSVAARSG
jgi:hypothetical protein